jgi:tetratricopeptide (TPR) repeat protein
MRASLSLSLALALNQTHDPNHLFVGIIEHALAHCYLILEKYDIAKIKVTKALQILQSHNIEAETILDFKHRLAQAIIYLGEYDEAETIINATLDMGDKVEPHVRLSALGMYCSHLMCAISCTYRMYVAPV